MTIDIEDVKAFCESRAKMLESAVNGIDENKTLYKSLYHQRWGSLQAFKQVIDYIENPSK